MSSPKDVVQRLLANTTNPSVIKEITHPDATYVSLCFSNPNLHRIMPHAGRSPQTGPEAYIYAFRSVNTIWQTEALTADEIFGEGENVAVFGRLTLRSRTLNKSYEGPFAIHAKVNKEGLLTHMLFMEDTFGTGSTFAKSGGTTYEVEEGKEFQIKAED